MTMEIFKTTIKGHRYEIGHFPALYNTSLAINFNACIGCSFGDFFSLFMNEGGKDFKNVGEGIHKIMCSLQVNDPNRELLLEILSQTKRDDIAINRTTFDQFYTGNIGEMMEALFTSIRVHFSPFFSEGNLFGALIGSEARNLNSVAS